MCTLASHIQLPLIQRESDTPFDEKLGTSVLATNWQVKRQVCAILPSLKVSIYSEKGKELKFVHTFDPIRSPRTHTHRCKEERGERKEEERTKSTHFVSTFACIQINNFSLHTSHVSHLNHLICHKLSVKCIQKQVKC